MDKSMRNPSALVTILLALSQPALADNKAGRYSFTSLDQCLSSGKLSREFCNNAAANSKAEYEQRAPRFPSREACERRFGPGTCSVGIASADGYAGKKSGLYFSPRQDGFTVMVNSERKASVSPIVARGRLSFGSRSILAKDTTINERVARQARNGANAGTRPGGGSGAYGEQAPLPGVHGDMPDRPPSDPNFDCSAFLEPGTARNGEPGCYPARNH